jgi:hypothetical protein
LPSEKRFREVVMSLTLIGRLLCAAQQTYDIVASGVTPPSPPQPAPPPSSLVGWLGDVPCQVGGDEEINAVMVGETASEVIVAFRGTEPFDSPDKARMILDWIDDLLVDQVPAPAGPGLVHEGFNDAVTELWDWTLAQVRGRTQTKPLYVIGHSKGGAMANIAATRFVAAGLKPYVCTYEAARCGDPTFAAGYATQVLNAVRYEYQDDVVPLLPPSTSFITLFQAMPGFAEEMTLVKARLTGGIIPNYVPVGDLHFINWVNQIVPDNFALEAQRIAHLLLLLFELNAAKIIDDHSIGPGSGVANVLCPGVWPLAPTA